MKSSRPGFPGLSGDWPPDEIARLLARVTRPGRYVGGEFNIRVKPGARPRIVLSYPDVYEIGISNPALQILYSQPERRHAGLRRARLLPVAGHGRPHARRRRAAVDASRAARRCATSDLWGFTLPHELPTPTSSRCSTWPACRCTPPSATEDDPIVLGGGPAVANPLAAGAVLRRLLRRRGRRPPGGDRRRSAAGARRAGAPAALAAVPGVWLPHGRRRGGRPERQVFTGFSAAPAGHCGRWCRCSRRVHDRVVIEVMRGCTAGCRFCQAGMWYRPVRERPVDLVVAAADRAARRDRLRRGLAALAELVRLRRRRARRSPRIRELRPGLRVSLPSLRIDSAADEPGALRRRPARLAHAGARGRHPAAARRHQQGRRRGRSSTRPCAATFEGGFTGLKLYFMIGLPGRDRRRRARHRPAWPASAARLAKEIGRGRARLSRVGVVVRAQGAHAVRAGAVRRRRARSAAGSSCVRDAAAEAACACASTTSPPRVVEATLARGGPGTDRLVEEAWRRGARFDGWSEHFDVRHLGGRGGGRLGIELGEPSVAARRPWRDAVDARVDDGLLRRRARARPRAASSPRTAATAPAPPAACAAARSRWSCSHELVARQLRARRPRPLPLAPGHVARGAAHVRARRRAHRAVAGHAAQAAPLAAAAAAGRRRGADELAVVEVPEGVVATTRAR